MQCNPQTQFPAVANMTKKYKQHTVQSKSEKK